MATVRLIGVREELRRKERQVGNAIGLEAAKQLRSNRSLWPVDKGNSKRGWVFRNMTGRFIRLFNPYTYSSFLEFGTRNYTPVVKRPALTTLRHGLREIIRRAQERVP